MSGSFRESVSPLAAIQAILHDYPFSASILRELLQNSDDAGATKQIFVLDMGKEPALLAYNNSQFQEEDWNAIKSIHESSKRADTSKIGKYGVGFRACYHVTDGPQILSGSSFAILDPIHAGGRIMGYEAFRITNHLNDFHFFSDIFEPSSFPGTVIRLPLRSSPSKLSERVVLGQELDQMIKDYINEELNISLLFLDKLRTIEIWRVHDLNKACLATWTKSEVKTERQIRDSSLFIYDTVLSDGHADFSWRIIRTRNADDEAMSLLSAQVGGEAVDHVFAKHKLCPDVRIAHPLFSDRYNSGRLFTFLPLPSRTDFPVHIHALFALTSSRQSLRNRNETGTVAGSDNDVLIKWNSLLFDRYIPQAWGHLLKTLAEDAASRDIFNCWPPYCSSITSGDGLYWQNILQATLTFAVQSSLEIWPKVDEKDSTTYVDLTSSLVVARGQVDLDVLLALARVGLTLVQLPQAHIQFLDDSITKLTPRVSRDTIERLGLISSGFNSLSQNQRRVLCGYFLSDNDFCDIYGLPLFPILDGSYVSLEDRRMTVRRYIALTSGEVDMFRASAGDAISLDQLQPNVAALVRERGTTQANIDLLSPPSVVTYLSREPEPRGDEHLAKFWSWLSEWQHRDQVMALLKANSSLRLVPTSKGPQLVSSTVFLVPGDRVFEKLGLTFVSSALSSTVVQFLNNQGVIKDANNMDDFLAAINWTAIQPLSDDEAKLVFDHVSTYYRSLSSNNLAKLKRLPIFPVLVPSTNQSYFYSNTSITWRTIDGLNVKGISPVQLIPLTDEINYLDKSCINNPSCSMLKALCIPELKGEDVLLHALGQFSAQPKSLRASFVSYIGENHRWTNSVVSELRKTRFIKSSDGTLQSPMDIIDPNSALSNLFGAVSSSRLIPVVEDDHDRKMLDDLRSLGMMKTSLSSDILQERLSYISANHTSPDALVVARFLVSLMNDPSFACTGLSIDHSLRWLPTHLGLISSNACIDCGRRDADLFDEVLTTFDSTISITPSFRSLLNWDKPLALDTLTKQLDRVLGQPMSEIQYRKTMEIIRELAGRQLGEADIKAIQQAIAGRPWVPTKSGTLALPSRAVFAGALDLGCFHEICFSQAQKTICMFLVRMGCHERPSTSAIISELDTLRGSAGTGRSIVEQAVQLLEMLPESITDKERASLLVPADTGELVPLRHGVCYYKGTISVDDGKIIAHHLINEKLAEKIGMQHLGVDEAENDVDLGGKPITMIRNTLRQYEPTQFFTEFIANASDAGAKQFSVLVDDHVGPTNSLLSESLAIFQGASLVVHNDGIFSRKDFTGILQTGIGGKRERSGVIGHFGLGALSMFHFTELAMIVSGDYVLFMSPSKGNLSFCGKHSVLLSLQAMKKLYADHLKPLDRLFGFDLSSTEPYQGTLFRLPLRNETHTRQDPLLTTPWSVTKVEEMLLGEFNKLAYKSLLFTGLGGIEVHKRQNGDTEVLRIINVTRVPDDPPSDNSFKSETVIFESPTLQLPKWLIVTMDANIPDNFRTELGNKHDIHHLLPMRIAAVLDGDQVRNLEHNLFCTLPLPVTTPLPAHISAPFILEQERRNIRIDSDGIGIESKYNRWLLSSELPRLYLCLLERLLQIQNVNIQWWPGMHSRGTNVPSQIFMDAFWSPEILKGCPRRIFVSNYSPPSSLSPNDVILFSEKSHKYTSCHVTLSKVLSLVLPPNIAELPIELFEYAEKAQLRSIDGPYVKELLDNINLPIQRLEIREISTLLRYLLDEKVPLDGLQIPLEDGSYTTLCSQYTKTNYVANSQQTAAYDLFKTSGRLIHRDFKLPKRLLELGLNVSLLDNAGIVELIEERIATAQEFLGDEMLQTWVTSFWKAKLDLPLESISHLPLIPTIKSFYFVSMSRISDPSVNVIDAEWSGEGFDYGILLKLGMTIVLKKPIPDTSLKLDGKKPTPYISFLEYMQKNQAEGLEDILRLNPSDQEKLARWARSKFSYTPKNLVVIALKLPIWGVQRRARASQLAALNDVIILPDSMPSDSLRPFTDEAIIDWDTNMRSVMENVCTALRITEILRISSGYILRSRTDREAYKRFIKDFLKFPRVNGYSLLVPNEEWVLTPAEDLFERHELFLASFKAARERLIPTDFQDVAEQLGKYGLNLRHRLDLAMFIECAKGFAQDDEEEDDEDRGDDRDYGDKRRMSEMLYTTFNTLTIDYATHVLRCRELDRLKFIPRDSATRKGYEGIKIKKYMRGDVLSPSKIVLAEYEAICWSQRGCVKLQPNPALCSTYRNLGKPTGKEVVKHLIVLAELGKNHGRRALLSDLKATYKWLNENVDEIASDIRNANSREIFLNVDDPDSDQWVWHSAATLVKDLHDVGDLHDVKGFLRNYDSLLKAAGVRTIQKTIAKPVAAMDRTSLHRSRFRELRERGFEVNVTFKAKDEEHQILPAHKAWLIMNSDHFWQIFVTSGHKESEPGKDVEVKMPNHSSLCVKEIIDWMYAGELSESITSPSSNDESKRKLDLALDMLSLSHYWEVTELFERLQEFIINASDDFINPYWVKYISGFAEQFQANKLLRACEYFEEHNREIIAEVN